MPTSIPLLLLSGACAMSAASVSAFQSVRPASPVGAIGAVGARARGWKGTAAARGRMAVLDGGRVSEEQLSMEAELCNDDGEEIDVRIDLERMEDDIDEFYSSGDGVVNGREEDKDDDKSGSKRLIECSASILLPFSDDVAFDAFSDLTRQPSWCKYLHSVEYIGLVDAEEEDAPNGIVPLRESKWTVGVKGLRFSWTARDTNIIRPKRIEWESTSGLKNMGSVEFVPSSNSTTNMTLHFAFVAPRVVSSLFRRSGKIRRYTEDVLLTNMLTDFRDVVMEEDL